MYLLFLVVAVTLFLQVEAQARAKVNCTLQPGEKEMNGLECCEITHLLEVLWNDGKVVLGECFESVRKPDEQNSTDQKRYKQCVDECAYEKLHLLTSEKELDLHAIEDHAMEMIDGKISKMLINALDKCFLTYKKDADLSLECKSGATEYSFCEYRELLLSCPSSYWTSNKECEDFRTKIRKCPELPVMWEAIKEPSA